MTLFSFNSNVLAQRGQRFLADATSSVSRSFERLSSGQRINSASDDAAGLSIADTLRNDSRIRTTAMRNLNDGLSAINIIDNGLSQQGSILDRLSELATQSANGSFSASQRNSLNDEYRSLVSEFGRLAESTSFNRINLLLGGRGNSNVRDLLLQAGVDGSVNSTLRMTTGDTGTFSGILNRTTLAAEPGSPSNYTLDQLCASYNNNMIQMTLTDSNGRSRDVMLGIAKRFASGIFFYKAQRAEDVAGGYPAGTWVDTANIGSAIGYDSTGTPTGTGWINGTFTFSDGSTASYSLDLRGLRISETGGGVAPNLGETTNIDISGVDTAGRALHAMDILRRRKDELMVLRGSIGSLESRARYALNLLASSKEAVSAAEGRIRDVDIAEETASLSASQIKQQTASKILSLANSQPKILLSLLDAT